MLESAVSKIYYRPIEAAIRWVGLLRYKDDILDSIEGPWHFSKKPDCPRLYELRLCTDRLYDAILNGDLPYGRQGITTNDPSLLESPELTIRHLDLKCWMQHHYPTQRPSFLFSQTERKIHPMITFEAGQAMLVEREALRSEVCQYRVKLQDLQEQQDGLLKQAEATPSCADCPISDRAETTFLHIIGSMLTLMLGKSPGGSAYSSFRTQDAIISALVVHFGHAMGITERTLQSKFAQAKRRLSVSDTC